MRVLEAREERERAPKIGFCSVFRIYPTTIELDIGSEKKTRKTGRRGLVEIWGRREPDRSKRKGEKVIQKTE